MYHQFKKFLNNILFFLSKTELVFKFVFFCVFTHDWVELFFTLIISPLFIGLIVSQKSVDNKLNREKLK